MINRTKALVLALFALYWVTVVTILVAAREVYDQAIRLPGGNQRPAEIGLLLVLGSISVASKSGGWSHWRTGDLLTFGL